jgi:hypothetical protein
MVRAVAVINMNDVLTTRIMRIVTLGVVDVRPLKVRDTVISAVPKEMVVIVPAKDVIVPQPAEDRIICGPTANVVIISLAYDIRIVTREGAKVVRSIVRIPVVGLVDHVGRVEAAVR